MQSGQTLREALYKLWKKKSFIYSSLEQVKFRRISAVSFFDQTFFRTDFNEKVDCQFNCAVFIFNFNHCGK